MALIRLTQQVYYIIKAISFYRKPQLLDNDNVQTTEQPCPDLLYGKWSIDFDFEDGLPVDFVEPNNDEPALDNIRRILQAFRVKKHDFLILANAKGEDFLQVVRSDSIVGHVYHVEYRLPDKEVLYGSEKDLSLGQTLSLFEMMLNDDPALLTAIKWEEI